MKPGKSGHGPPPPEGNRTDPPEYHPLTSHRRAELLLLFATFIWGSTFVVTKGLLDETSPLLYTALRFLAAALLIFLIFPGRVRRTAGNTIVPGIILGSLLFAGFALQTIGLEYTSASKSAFFTGMLVVFTPIFHYAARKWFRVTGKALLVGNLTGVILSALGLYLLTSPAGGEFNAGDAMTLLAAAIFAVYIVYLDFGGRGIEKMPLTFVTFLVCGIEGGCAALGWEVMEIRMGISFLLPLAYLTIFATVIALGIQNRFQGDTTPTRAAVIFALEPVIAAFLAYFFRGEDIGTTGIIGGSVIFTGLILSELSDNVPIFRLPLFGDGTTTGEEG